MASEIPPDLDVRSRRIREWCRQQGGEWDVLSCPDFGGTMASRLMSTGRTCPSLNEPPYIWIRKGIERLELLGKPGVRDTGVLAVTEADALHGSAMRVTVQAVLLADDSSVETVAAALGLALPVVDAYTTLYFDVLDRKDDAAYRETAVRAALTCRGRVYDPDDVNPDDASLLNTGLRGTVQDVMGLAARSGRISVN